MSEGESNKQTGTPTYEDLVSKVYDQEKIILEKDGIIGQYQATIDDLNDAVKKRDERINKLQGIIADHIPVTTGKPPESEVKVNKSFADMYSEMIAKNNAIINKEV